MTPIDLKDLLTEMAAKGINVAGPMDLVPDGKIKRFSTKDNKSWSKNGWTSTFRTGRGDLLVCFGAWDTPDSWGIYRNGRQFDELTTEEKAQEQQETARLRTKVNQEQAEMHKKAQEQALLYWNEAKPACEDNPYLKRKGIHDHGFREDAEHNLLIPLYDEDEAICSIEKILPVKTESGNDKIFLKGGKMKSCAFCINGKADNKIFIAEGVATAASINEATGQETVIAFSAYNLGFSIRTIAKILRRKGKPIPRFVIVADNDGDKQNTGEEEAKKAISENQDLDVSMVTVPVTGYDANDYANDPKYGKEALRELLATETTKEDPFRLVPIDEFLIPTPNKWLIMDWLQANSLTMMYGKSGCGKTFAAISEACAIASGMKEWCGHEITKQGNVIYFCGEAASGLRLRIKAWEIANDAKTKGHLWIMENPFLY
jgi:phage/plasmid primase-like uncharacterized protein